MLTFDTCHLVFVLPSPGQKRVEVAPHQLKKKRGDTCPHCYYYYYSYYYHYYYYYYYHYRQMLSYGKLTSFPCHHLMQYKVLLLVGICLYD